MPSSMGDLPSMLERVDAGLLIGDSALSAKYESCEAAEAAGESRVQGSMGAGRGFPQAMVSGSRYGDGDGVVCER